MKRLSAFHSHVFIAFLACAGILVLSTTSQAISIDETITKNDADLGHSDGSMLADQTFSFTGLNPYPTGDATITFSVRGDFGIFLDFENVVLSVDGFSFGTWINNDDTDDEIAGPAGDVGDEYGSVLTGTAVIPLATFSGLVMDGSLDFFFDYSGDVNDLVGFEGFASVQVQYEARDTAPIPEPGTIFLFGSGLAGLAAWRYRKHTVKA